MYEYTCIHIHIFMYVCTYVSYMTIANTATEESHMSYIYTYICLHKYIYV